MAHYRLQLTMHSPLSTPLHSGTLFGHLCWAWHQLYGEESLTRWLASLPTEGPFLLSSGSPRGYLPTPVMPPPAMPENMEMAQWLQVKRLHTAPWLRLEDFLGIRAALTPAALYRALADTPQPATLDSHRVAHNTINRRTNRTLDRGGLYFVDELWPNEEPARQSSEWDVYVQSSLAPEQVQSLFQFVGEHGYGRDASLGRGQFRAVLSPAPAGLFEFPGTHLLSLSHGAPLSPPKHARYRLTTHYGKLGFLKANTDRPFKYPLLLMRPGANFSAGGASPFGQMFRGIAPTFPEACHNAWHLTVPFNEKEA